MVSGKKFGLEPAQLDVGQEKNDSSRFNTGFTSSPGREAKYEFSGFVPTKNKKIK